MIKKLLLYTLCLLLINSCSNNKSELLKETDFFVESLSTTYESYGILGVSEYSKTTTDGLYSITPMGRLINVKIQKVVESEEYEELKQDLKDYYKDNTKVKDVYICKAGTIMIDCRN